ATRRRRSSDRRLPDREVSWTRSQCPGPKSSQAQLLAPPMSSPGTTSRDMRCGKLYPTSQVDGQLRGDSMPSNQMSDDSVTCGPLRDRAVGLRRWRRRPNSIGPTTTLIVRPPPATVNYYEKRRRQLGSDMPKGRPSKRSSRCMPEKNRRHSTNLRI